MDRLRETAARILEIAEEASRSGLDTSTWTIYAGAGGGIEMIHGGEWALDALAAARGARMVWRVGRRERFVRVEGRAGADWCEIEAPAPAARRMWPWPQERNYLMEEDGRPREVRRRAGSAPLLPAASD